VHPEYIRNTLKADKELPYAVGQIILSWAALEDAMYSQFDAVRLLVPDLPPLKRKLRQRIEQWAELHRKYIRHDVAHVKSVNAILRPILACLDALENLAHGLPMVPFPAPADPAVIKISGYSRKGAAKTTLPERFEYTLQEMWNIAELLNRYNAEMFFCHSKLIDELQKTSRQSNVVAERDKLV
jgi:hypothetical protein